MSKKTKNFLLKKSILTTIAISVIVLSGITFTFFQYREISDRLAYSEKLSESGKYEDAIEKLESISNIWLSNKIGVKEEVSNKIDKNEQFIEDKNSYNKGIEEFNEKNWNKAKESLSKISSNSPHYEKAKKKVEKIEDIIFQQRIEEKVTKIKEDSKQAMEEIKEEAEKKERELQEQQEELEDQLKNQEEVEERYVIVETDLLRTSDYEIIDTISKGSKVELIEEKSKWSLVKKEDKEGFISNNDLSADSSDIMDLADIVEQWKKIVVFIKSEFRYSDTNNLYAEHFGSGIVINPNNGPITVITNKHLAIHKGEYSASSFDVLLPERNHLYESEWEDLSVLPSEDGAFIDINNTNRYIRDLTSDFPKTCQQRPSEGDKVVILGYPDIGSREGITVTKGIISGFEGDYYITDAKIDEGNSGGAAILTKRNCLLGVPTYARLGETESLGRILDISMFLK